jgi:ferric-dicitrate binding protein FerR (iron transport regulator)
MNHTNNIESLIRKFNDGDISTEELSFLISYLKENEPQSELLGLYEKVWNEIEIVNSRAQSSKIYKNILKKIKKENDRPNVFFSVLKYAAILMLGFGLSFLFRTGKQSVINTSGVFQQITVPYGSKSSVILPDGSTVILNSGSKLKYSTNFDAQNSRDVSLEGEAFFNVKKNKHRPFYVSVAGIKVKVLGTSFNIKAYPDEKNIETTLVTGSVEIYKDNNSKEEDPIAVLKPNQRAILEKSSRTLSIESPTNTEETIFQPSKTTLKATVSIESEVETVLTTAWKDDKLIFNNELFSDIAKRIERWYGVKIVVVNYPELENTRLSGKFDRETVEQAIDALKYAIPFQFNIDKNVITIRK